jgi:hypothetical protein
MIVDPWKVGWDEPSNIGILPPAHGVTVFLLRAVKPQVMMRHSPLFKIFLTTQMILKL